MRCFNVIRCLACVGVTLMAAACLHRAHDELTTTKPYADLIGAEYEIATSDVRAYGIYSLDNRTLGWVQLMGGQGASGPEVAFRKNVKRGTTIKILSAWRSYSLTDSDDYYVVAIDGIDLPSNVPVRVELNRGNEGEGVDLNPNVYSKLSRSK
jgi:hypothetical protein